MVQSVCNVKVSCRYSCVLHVTSVRWKSRTLAVRSAIRRIRGCFHIACTVSMPCLSRLASIVTLRAPARVHPALRAGLFLGATAAAAASALAAPPAVCTAPIGSAATAGAIVVGNGTPASCTESVLQAAINASSVVTFNCGSAAATIPLTTTLVLPPTRQTVIDGGGKVTLDGGGRVRLMQLVHPDFRTNRA